MIVPAETLDDKKLSEIALQSKAYWNYSQELLNSWKEDLTVTSKMIASMNVFKFIEGKKIAGFYILNQPKNTEIALKFLFVHPNFIGKNIGKQLLLHAFGFAKELHCKKIIVLSDPNAELFYQRFGFVTVKHQESSVKNRFLPILHKNI